MPRSDQLRTPPAPLFEDPVFDGPTDPAVIRNRPDNEWWIVYTSRRATGPDIGYAWVHGTALGVASSRDGGHTWVYRGTLRGLEIEPGMNTFWAPEIILVGDVYHMYVSYVQGVPTTWNFDRKIIHYTSDNLWDWRYESILELSSSRVIDAAVFRMPDGAWRMWYKDEIHQSHSYLAESDDLYRWSVRGPAVTCAGHEGPNVFYWRGRYWMIADMWKGLMVLESEDCENWKRQADILDKPGSRKGDGAIGHHADVLVCGDDAYIFYFTHPEQSRRSVIQVAKLETAADGTLVCHRDAPFDFRLPNTNSEL